MVAHRLQIQTELRDEMKAEIASSLENLIPKPSIRIGNTSWRFTLHCDISHS